MTDAAFDPEADRPVVRVPAAGTPQPAPAE